jgi:hypothetical protein
MFMDGSGVATDAGTSQRVLGGAAAFKGHDPGVGAGKQLADKGDHAATAFRVPRAFQRAMSA